MCTATVSAEAWLDDSSTPSGMQLASMGCSTVQELKQQLKRLHSAAVAHEANGRHTT